jgi:hypothetical protein
MSSIEGKCMLLRYSAFNIQKNPKEVAITRLAPAAQQSLDYAMIEASNANGRSRLRQLVTV